MAKRTYDQIDRDLAQVRRALRFRRERGLSRSEVAKITGLSLPFASDALRRLRELGEVQIEGDKSLARYFLKRKEPGST